jgi:hypothetical protein
VAVHIVVRSQEAMHDAVMSLKIAVGRRLQTSHDFLRQRANVEASKDWCELFFFFFFFKSTIYYAVLDRSPRQTIQKRVQPTGIYVQDWKGYYRPDIALSSGDEPRPRFARARERQRILGAQAPPQTSPGPQRAPPPTRAIHTQGCSQPKPDTRVTREV